MNEKSSQADLEKKCRQLARKWHPDRFQVNILKDFK